MVANASLVYASSRIIKKSPLTQREIKLDPAETIVSKTNTKGLLTYANEPFLSISGYTEREVLGQQHSILRHPAMPRCIFKILWDTIKDGHEIFAYVVNRCKNGDHYWVFAHVTPCYGLDGSLVGFHSSRRAPKASAVEAVVPLYQKLVALEESTERKAGLEASENMLNDMLAQKRISYGEFVFSL